ncbi:restriction endonuclease subunit S [Avibacterium avium]|uniref:restriction endonuclease subunit S n=1 Tax=Avibacterium avium TaxID=751 RepID=UPI003BF88641
MSNIPKLRFPEFTDAWEKCKLGKSFKIKRGLTYKPENIVTNGGIRVLRSSNIDEDTFQLKDDDVFVSRESINIDFVENLDILITSANGSSRLVGKHAIIQHIDNEMVHGGFMLLGKSKEPFFINALLSAPWYEKFINKNVSGGNGAIGNLKAKDLENAVISLPTLPEQQKIGNLFKQLDRLITLHKRKWDDVILLKKALLQKMFPKNGSDFPEIRFPEFTDAWEKCKLGDVIIDEIKGKAKADMLGEQSLYLDANYLNGGNELYVNSPTDVDKNDVIILWDGSQAGTVYHGFSGALGSTFKAFRPKQSGAFLYQQLKRYQDTIYNSYRTPNIPHVIKSFTKEFNISIPNYEEQQKIGNLFKQLDRLITLHKRQHEHYQLLKKALLQQMFV